MANQLPKLKLPLSPLEKVAEIVGLIGILLILGLLLFNWGSLPATIPTHFGVSGKADDFGDKWTILLIPGIATILYLAITVLSRYPNLYNYPWRITAENAPQQYKIFRQMITLLKAEAMFLMGYIEWGIVEVANGRGSGLNAIFLPIVLILITGTIAFPIYQGYKAR